MPSSRSKPGAGARVNWAHVFSQGLVHRTLFNGGNPVDIVTGRIGVPSGSSPPTISLADGGAQLFVTGTTANKSYLDYGVDPMTADLGLGPFTCIARVFYANTGGTGGGIARRNDGNTVSAGWEIGTNGTQFGFAVENSSFNTVYLVADPPTGRWLWITVVHDGIQTANTPGKGIYYDNVRQAFAQGQNGSGSQTSDKTESLRVGEENFSTIFSGQLGTATWGNGLISDFALYKGVAFTADMVKDFVAHPYANLGYASRRAWIVGTPLPPNTLSLDPTPAISTSTVPSVTLVTGPAPLSPTPVVSTWVVPSVTLHTHVSLSLGHATSSWVVPSSSVSLHVAGLITQHGVNVVRLAPTLPRITQHGVNVVRISDPCTASVTYEDPCQIRNRVMWAVVQDENGDVVIQAANKPSRDAASHYGGYKPPRLLGIDGVTRAATDYITRMWQAQSATVTLADTDRVLRGSTRNGWVGCQLYLYLISEELRRRGGYPRLLFQGPVYDDPLQENMRTSITANDVIGIDYSLFSESKMIPQRITTSSDFPGCPASNMGFGIPIVFGTTEEDTGAVELYHVGSVTYNSLTKHAWMVSGHAITGLELYQDDTLIEDGDPNVWQPFFTNWTDFVPSGNKFVTINSHVYVLVFMDDWRVAAVDGGASLNKTSWTATTAYVKGDAVTPAGNMINGQGKFLFCTTAGTTGSSDTLTVPAPGLPLTDGSVTWTVVSDTPKPLYANTHGFDRTAAGTADEITDGIIQAKYILINFLIQSYTSGAWLPSPRFESYPGNGDFICRVDVASFDVATDTARTYLPDTGFVGGGVIGAGGKRQSVRQVWADLLHSFNLMFCQSQYQQLKVKMLDRRREKFIQDPTTITDRRDVLSSPKFKAPKKREWLCNDLGYHYRPNYRNDGRGDWNAFDSQGNAPSKDRYGTITKIVTLPYVRDDDTADAVAGQELDFRAELRRVATYSQSLCGLKRDVLDGVQMTNYAGTGTSGWRDIALWILSQKFDGATNAIVSFEAVDVQDLISAIQTLRVFCPSHIDRTSSDGNPVTVTFSDPSITGGRDPITGSYDHASGSSFPVGTTVVTYTATSSDGQIATCFFTITVVSTLSTHTLTVTFGTGDGPYLAGAIVPVVADAPATGKRFLVWTGDVSTMTDIHSSSTSLTMLPTNMTIVATYEDIVVPSGKLEVAWDARPDDEFVLGYLVQWGTTTGGPYPNSIDVGLTTDYVITGLTVGTTYYIVIRSYNSITTSGPSAEVSDVAVSTP